MRNFDIKWPGLGALSQFSSKLTPCYLCGTLRDCQWGLCQGCLNDLPKSPQRLCPRCAQSVVQPGLCLRCMQDPPLFTHTLTALEYRYPADVLVRDLKYRGQIQLSPGLASLLAKSVQPASVDRITFVPQSRERQRERGYNQAQELARQLSRQTGIPLLKPAPQRVRATPHQASLDAKARQENLNQAFLCRGGVAGLRIAVVDDVITTGATQNALAKTLLEAGAGEISAWVVARTPPRDFP